MQAHAIKRTRTHARDRTHPESQRTPSVNQDVVVFARIHWASPEGF